MVRHLIAKIHRDVLIVMLVIGMMILVFVGVMQVLIAYQTDKIVDVVEETNVSVACLIQERDEAGQLTDENIRGCLVEGRDD